MLRIQMKGQMVSAYTQDIAVLQNAAPNYLTINECHAAQVFHSHLIAPHQDLAMAFRHRPRLQDDLTVRGTADDVDAPSMVCRTGSTNLPGSASTDDVR